MLIAIVFAGLVTVVALLSRRLKDSPYAPRSCCSNHRWPPDDLTGRHGEHPASARSTDRPAR